jgi:hypothetical protein
MKAKIHPLVALKEKTQGEIISFKGYVGTEINDTTRLYTDLTCSSYYEIPNKAILYNEEDECKDCGSDGQVLIYVHEHTEILFIEKFRADKYNAFLHEKYKNFDFKNQSISIPISLRLQICYRNCIERIRLNLDFFQRFEPGNGIEAIFVTLNSKGLEELRKCLVACGFSGDELDKMVEKGANELSYMVNPDKDPPMPKIPPFPFPLPSFPLPSPFPWPFPFPPSPFPFNYKY